MTETQFWKMIEGAWMPSGGWNSERQSLASGTLSDDVLEELSGVLDEVISSLTNTLQALSKDELFAFDRILEQKLWDIDRADIQEFTDGSDDGFLYARGFIVALGKDYYDAVSALPSRARMDVECEDMCYLSHYIYEEKFSEMPESEISRESASNPEGWPEE